jgi:hypothetical protein
MIAPGPRYHRHTPSPAALRRSPSIRQPRIEMTEEQRIELEAAAFRQLVQHLRSRPDVQNIDLMNLAGFCRNCLSKWYKAAADDLSLDVSAEQAREEIYGMPYADWKGKYQKEASAEQKAAFEKGNKT